MNLIMYECTDDERKLNKSLSTLGSITCSVQYDNTSSLMSPNVMINRTSFNFNCNYCYISSFNRYYFIKNVQLMTGDMIFLTLEVDVLMSFNGYISGIKTVIERQENVSSDNIQDNKVPVRSNRIVTFKTVGTLSGNSIILTVNGG